MHPLGRFRCHLEIKVPIVTLLLMLAPSAIKMAKDTTCEKIRAGLHVRAFGRANARSLILFTADAMVFPDIPFSRFDEPNQKLYLSGLTAQSVKTAYPQLFAYYVNLSQRNELSPSMMKAYPIHFASLSHYLPFLYSDSLCAFTRIIYQIPGYMIYSAYNFEDYNQVDEMAASRDRAEYRILDSLPVSMVKPEPTSFLYYKSNSELCITGTIIENVPVKTIKGVLEDDYKGYCLPSPATEITAITYSGSSIYFFTTAEEVEIYPTPDGISVSSATRNTKLEDKATLSISDFIDCGSEDVSTNDNTKTPKPDHVFVLSVTSLVLIGAGLFAAGLIGVLIFKRFDAKQKKQAMKTMTQTTLSRSLKTPPTSPAAHSIASNQDSSKHSLMESKNRDKPSQTLRGRGSRKSLTTNLGPRVTSSRQKAWPRVRSPKRV